MSKGTPLNIPHLEAKPDTGTPRIVDKGVTVSFVGGLYHYHKMSVEEICEEYNLTPGEVYAALSYYADHKEELEQKQREAEEMMDRYFKEHPERDVRQRFIERKKNREGQ